jgi:hypothetical protein
MRKLMRKEPIVVINILLKKTFEWYVLGYKISNNLDYGSHF